jgi:hypothetical protein
MVAAYENEYTRLLQPRRAGGVLAQGRH